jgi:hypothetical protein
MDYLPLLLKVVLWVSVGAALVYAFVSSRRHKISVNDKSKLDPNYVASKILSELQDQFFREGSDELVDVYQLGIRLGFSREQVRAALSTFEKNAQIDVVILTERHVKLGIRGQMMRRPEGWSRSDGPRRLRKDT